MVTYCYVPLNKKSLFELWLKDKKITKKKENLFVIFTDDQHLIRHSRKKIILLPQIFVDIYSLSGITRKYFISEILEKYPVFKTTA